MEYLNIRFSWEELLCDKFGVIHLEHIMRLKYSYVLLTLFSEMVRQT